VSAPSLLFPVAGSLALTLGIFLLAARLLGRWPMGMGQGPTASGSTPRVGGRVFLAPNQGVATVEVEGRILLVSFGEGGVRLVTELAPVPQDAEVRETPTESTGGRWAPGWRERGPRIFRALALAAAVLASGWGVGTEGLAAQATPAPVAAPVVPQAAQGAPPTFQFQVGGEGDEGIRVQGPVGAVLFVGAMTLLPTLLLLMTSFTRILVVLHLLKQALGTQTAPPAHLLAAMALLLTAFIMGPTLEEANRTALTPWLAGEIDEAAMLQRASLPFREFMLTQVREEDLATFAEMRPEPMPETVEELPLTVVTSAFMTSELRAAFQMGFALFLPFVVIDLVVASVLMSMGMFMLPPVMISLPFKLLLFVMVDGWSILVGSLVQSFLR